MNTKEILFQKALTDQMKGAAEFLQIDLSRDRATKSKRMAPCPMYSIFAPRLRISCIS